MKRGFIKNVGSASELQKFIEIFDKSGIEYDDIIVNQDFKDFIKTATPGDTIVIHSYTDVFNSMTDFYTTVIELNERNISLESLSETDIIIGNENIDCIRSLYQLSHKLRKSATCKGLDRLRLEGKKLGRPPGSTKLGDKVSDVTKLRETLNMSISKACSVSGITPRTYYRHKEKLKK